jgi:hypothetical protein
MGGAAGHEGAIKERLKKAEQDHAIWSTSGQ